MKVYVEIFNNLRRYTTSHSIVLYMHMNGHIQKKEKEINIDMHSIVSYSLDVHTQL